MTSRGLLPDDAAQVTGIPEKDAPMDDEVARIGG